MLGSDIRHRIVQSYGDSKSVQCDSRCLVAIQNRDATTQVVENNGVAQLG
ncbi:hypothetical protein CA13_08500 [Planctomycetes bacterium CA13]|uniref:Uncharacterized protein n=1 Tax=Novipirellula herctigrandis TaxID=2527986 RepID=A0A5C5YWK3_9BACT|nr:hypothetical protein CA13_08500 [Planctomycetes bacterium CA13]